MKKSGILLALVCGLTLSACGGTPESTLPPGEQLETVGDWFGPSLAAWGEAKMEALEGCTLTLPDRTGKIADARITCMDLAAETGRVDDAATLQAWKFGYEIRLEGEDDWQDPAGERLLLFQHQEDEGWVSLRAELNAAERDALFDRYDRPEEALYDWYCTENDLFLVEKYRENGFHREDGEGWLLYRPETWTGTAAGAAVTWTAPDGSAALTVRHLPGLPEWKTGTWLPAPDGGVYQLTVRGTGEELTRSADSFHLDPDHHAWAPAHVLPVETVYETPEQALRAALWLPGFPDAAQTVRWTTLGEDLCCGLAERELLQETGGQPVLRGRLVLPAAAELRETDGGWTVDDLTFPARAGYEENIRALFPAAGLPDRAELCWPELTVLEVEPEILAAAAVRSHGEAARLFQETLRERYAEDSEVRNRLLYTDNLLHSGEQAALEQILDHGPLEELPGGPDAMHIQAHLRHSLGEEAGRSRGRKLASYRVLGQPVLWGGEARVPLLFYGGAFDASGEAQAETTGLGAMFFHWDGQSWIQEQLVFSEDVTGEGTLHEARRWLTPEEADRLTAERVETILEELKAAKPPINSCTVPSVS